METPSLKLISFTLCPYVQRALIVLREKNIPHEIEYIDLSSPPPWFYDISPLEKVPVLLVNNEPLFESIPIIEFIDDISPPSLYPDDPFEKARQKAWMEFGNEILSGIYSFYTSEDESTYRHQHRIIMDRLDILEEHLTQGPYFAGDTFSMVDTIYGPLFRYLNALSSLSGENFFHETPQVRQWSEQLLARESVQKSVPATYMEEIRTYISNLNSIFSQKLD